MFVILAIVMLNAKKQICICCIRGSKKYETSFVSTRQGSNISEEALTKLNNLVTPLIKQGQSVKLIYRNHKDEIPCPVNCLYNYINCGLFSVKNIDLFSFFK